MALKIEEESFIKALYAKEQKNIQIKALAKILWEDVQVLKDSDNKNKWTSIATRKKKFYADSDLIKNN